MSNAVQSGVIPGVTYVASFDQLRMTDVESVGGKNASLGEMISQLAGAGVRVPGGFATTAHAFRDFLSHSVNGGPSLMFVLWPKQAQKFVNGLSTRRSNHVCNRKLSSSIKNLLLILQVKSHSLCVPRQQQKTCRMHHLQVSRKPS